MSFLSKCASVAKFTGKAIVCIWEAIEEAGEMERREAEAEEKRKQEAARKREEEHRKMLESMTPEQRKIYGMEQENLKLRKDIKRMGMSMEECSSEIDQLRSRVSSLED